MSRPVPAIAPPTGKLGILLVGLGAISTTLIAGVYHMRRMNGTVPIGSMTQLGTIRLGERTEQRNPRIKDFVPLANLDDIVFGAWDPIPDNGFVAAIKAGVLMPTDIEQVSRELRKIVPMRAVFDPELVPNLKDTTNVKTYPSFGVAVGKLRDDIRMFRDMNGCDRVVMIWCGSTERYVEPHMNHNTLSRFEATLNESDLSYITPSMLYAYAALMEGVPFINGSPNKTDIPALTELAIAQGVPIAGKDFKTGQTLMKTVIAPMLRARSLGLDGWYSTNILGNRDGEVLDDPEAFRAKEETKLSVLDTLLSAKDYPELYTDFSHVVRINYYPPRGDSKEGWDNIDIKGWMGYLMQIKVNFLCRDSILAAPLALDLALFMDLAARAQLTGVQEWLSFYFKAPQVRQAGLPPEHDLFIQQTKLKNTLRTMMGEDPITHVE